MQRRTYLAFRNAEFIAENQWHGTGKGKRDQSIDRSRLGDRSDEVIELAPTAEG
jgi:hypothetical protein